MVQKLISKYFGVRSSFETSSESPVDPPESRIDSSCGF